MTESYDEDGNKLSHKVKSGVLSAPVFEELTPLNRWKRPPKRGVKYNPLLAVVRAHPGQAAKVAEFKLGTFTDKEQKWSRSKSRQQAVVEKQYLVRWIDMYFPLECWKVFVRTTPGTWGDREVWVRYDGTWTEEERQAAKVESAKKARWQRELVAKNKAEREAKARAQIFQMQRQRGTNSRG